MNARDRTWDALFDVVDRHLSTFRPATIFDVGANVGETAETFSQRFPNASIHAFEPVSATFLALADHTRSKTQIQCHQVALSDQSSAAWMQVPEKSKQARIVSSEQPVAGAEEVRTVAGDAFRIEQDIDMIDFLKIDTEGHDLEVLHGFETTLASQKVGLIDIEVGLATDNDRHIPLNAVQVYLEGLGYPLFWLHERKLDLYFSGRPILRRANAVFVSTDLVKANTKRAGKQVSSIPERAPKNSQNGRPLRRRVRRALRLR